MIMKTSITLDLKAAREFVKSNKVNNGLSDELILDAINSIEKRIEYLKYFYIEFRKMTLEVELAFDRIGVYRDSEGLVLRNKYEATAFAFLSNLHEMIDAYPFIYLGIFSDKNPLLTKIGWDILVIEDGNLKSKIASLKGNHNFKILKKMNNYRKHGALPKIKNQFTFLEINIDFNGCENYKNLTKLMHNLHDKLIPQYFEILRLTFKLQ